MFEEIRKKIREYALENAIKFEGVANQGAILGKLFAYDDSIKKNMKELSGIINEEIKKVNSISLEEQKKELLKLNPEFEKEQEDKKKENKELRSDLPPLKDAIDGQVVMRIAPEPSKYNHIGHAISFLINYMYALRHKGKCILRFDDTNPEKESQEFVDAMKEDVIEYLDVKIDETVFASDRISKYIEISQNLIKENNAYVCGCSPESVSLNRRSMKTCSCRNNLIEDNLRLFEEMKLGGKGTRGDNLVLRLKIDMEHKNAVMRDPVIFRIINAPHYRQGDKFKVWPMYDFECAIIEAELGITHVLRSNEFESRIELQNYIREVCGFKKHPLIKQYARYEVTGAITQGREIRKKIETGEMTGWDDPRLMTLKSLKRRGIIKDSYYELAKIIGMSKTNSKIDFSVISSINRKLLDSSAKRFFFIENPIKIKILKSPKKGFELEMHPQKDLGKRKFRVDENYIIDKKDYERFKKDEIIRLIDNINFKNLEFISEKYEDFRGRGELIIHFLPDDESQLIKTKILMPTNEYIQGVSEKSIETLSLGEIIQFQRFGFCRLDEIKEDGTRIFWYTHD